MCTEGRTRFLQHCYVQSRIPTLSPQLPRNDAQSATSLGTQPWRATARALAWLSPQSTGPAGSWLRRSSSLGWRNRWDAALWDVDAQSRLRSRPEPDRPATELMSGAGKHRKGRGT